MKVITKQYALPVKKQESSAPLTLTWKNARMIRNHSINNVAKEILNANITSEVVKVNLIGTPSTGKTTCGKVLCHLIHQFADRPYAVKIFNRDDLMNFENVLHTFQPMNYVLMFDDISWLSAGNPKQKIDQLNKTFTEIRHLPGGKDVKIIIIFNFHYNFAIPPALRQADFFMYFEIGSSELENMDKVVGSKNRQICLDFIKIKHQIKATSTIATATEPEYKGNFSYPIGRWGKFTYQHRSPFAPAIFWNRDSLRHVVFPTREWIDPICSTCTGTSSVEGLPKGDVKKFVEYANTNYNQIKVKTALRIFFLLQGINVLEDNVNRALKWVQKEFKDQSYDLEEIMKAYDLEISTSRTFTKTIKEKERIEAERIKNPVTET